MKMGIIKYKRAYLATIAALLMFACNAFPQQQNTLDPTKMVVNDTLVYWYSGRPETREEWNAMRDVFQRYGATATRVSGCLLADSSTASIDEHNQKLFSLIKENYGYSKGQIMQQVDSLQKYYTRIVKILKGNREYKALEKEAIAKGKSLDFRMIKQPDGPHFHTQVAIFYFDPKRKHDDKSSLETFGISNGKAFGLISMPY